MSATNLKARIFGRLFRLGFGIFFATEVIPVYQAVDVEGIIIRLGWALALVIFYLLLHLMIQRFGLAINPILGPILANVPILAVFFIGYGGPAATGALTYLSPALIIAAIRADPACEVMSIPAFFTGKHTSLGCFLFSPIDWIERRFS